MRQIDLTAFPPPWDEDQLQHLASEVILSGGDVWSSRAVSSPVDHSSAAAPTSPNKESVFAWMAGRIRWELRLEELRDTCTRAVAGSDHC